MRVTEWPDPILGPRDFLVQVARCGVCGSDLRTFFRGPSPRYRLPAILGHEFVGTIAETGEHVKGFQRGDRVTAAPAVPCGECFYCRRGEDNLCRQLLDFGINFEGGFAELIRIPARSIESGGLVKLKQDLSDDLAVWAEPLATVLHAQERAKISASHNVTVVGDGPMGLLHALAAKDQGATHVSVIGHHAKRLELARQVGADMTVMESEANAIKGDSDVVIVAVSDGAAVESSFGLVRDGGVVVAFGGSSRESRVSISPYRLHYGEVTLMGSFNCTTEDFKHALELIPRLNLKPLRPRVVPLEAIVDGFRAAYAREAIKVVVEMTR